MLSTDQSETDFILPQAVHIVPLQFSQNDKFLCLQIIIRVVNKTRKT